MIFQNKSQEINTNKMNSKKINSDITTILMTKLNREEAKDLADQILEKLSSFSLKKTTPKRKKDKDSPKNPQNAYMFFCNATRESTKKENSGIDAKNIIRVISEKWRNMSDEEKLPYKEMSDKDKTRYRSEIDVYKNNTSATVDVVEEKNETKKSKSGVPVPHRKTVEKKETTKKKLVPKTKKEVLPPPKAVVVEEEDDDTEELSDD